MSKLKAYEQTDYCQMYVYSSQMYGDLISYVIEYLGEAEHNGMTAEMRELSKDTVEDVKQWCERRKELLLEDFLLYYQDHLPDDLCHRADPTSRVKK